MALDYDKLLAWPFPEVEQAYTERDVMLYALGLGLGGEPTNRQHLRYVYEEGLEVFPTMITSLASPGFWMRDPASGVNWRKVMAAEQKITLHRRLPVNATVVSRMKVTDIYDKGANKGALLCYRRELHGKQSGEHLCSIEGSTFLRGDGGFSATRRPSPPAAPLPEGPPDVSLALATLPQAALIFRLSGDYNPLHADPASAELAGFPRPVLHGLCTYGMACRALVEAVAVPRALEVRSFSSRFVAPVFPGETLVTDFWQLQPGRFALRCRVAERDVVVLNGGQAELAPAAS
jgi:acyl dehydratase